MRCGEMTISTRPFIRPPSYCAQLPSYHDDEDEDDDDDNVDGYDDDVEDYDGSDSYHDKLHLILMFVYLKRKK